MGGKTCEGKLANFHVRVPRDIAAPARTPHRASSGAGGPSSQQGEPAALDWPSITPRTHGSQQSCCQRARLGSPKTPRTFPSPLSLGALRMLHGVQTSCGSKGKSPPSNSITPGLALGTNSLSRQRAARACAVRTLDWGSSTRGASPLAQKNRRSPASAPRPTRPPSVEEWNSGGEGSQPWPPAAHLLWQLPARPLCPPRFAFRARGRTATLERRNWHGRVPSRNRRLAGCPRHTPIISR